MRRPFLVVLVGLGVGACGSHQHGAPSKLTPKDIVQRSSPAIVRIETDVGLGTGFIIDKAGLVATNLHVVRGKKEIRVKLYGGETYPVLQIAGVDPGRDLAVLRIGPTKALPTLHLGDSDQMTAGDQVVAIGNPLGVFDYSVSSGLVSQVRPVCTREAVDLHNKNVARFEELAAKTRNRAELTRSEEEELERLQCSQELKILQISAPISQGSSGGPLFNQSGEVVGVTTAIITAGQNINLAIPTNYLKAIAARPAQISMDDFAAKTKEAGEDDGKIDRKIPHHALTVFDGCNGDQISDLVASIWEAIEAGAPLYNKGDSEGCFRTYETTGKRFLRTGACQGIRSAFDDGLKRADTLGSFKEKAWAMRDAFDGLLQAANDWVKAGNKLPEPKKP